MNKINLVLAVSLACAMVPASAMNHTGRVLAGCAVVGSATGAVLIGSINAIEKKNWQKKHEAQMKASECVECNAAYDAEVIALLKAKSFDAWDEEQAALATEARAAAKGETSQPKQEVRKPKLLKVISCPRNGGKCIAEIVAVDFLDSGDYVIAEVDGDEYDMSWAHEALKRFNKD